MCTIEDKRTAVSINAGISSQILSASLVLIGVLLGYYDLKNIEFNSASGIIIIIAIICLLVSFIIGGYGLKKIRDNGLKGDWDIAKTHINFRLQTWLNYFAIICFIIVFLIPGNKSDQIKALEQINQNLTTIVKIDSSKAFLEKEIKELKAKVSTLEKKIESVKFQNSLIKNEAK